MIRSDKKAVKRQYCRNSPIPKVNLSYESQPLVMHLINNLIKRLTRNRAKYLLQLAYKPMANLASGSLYQSMRSKLTSPKRLHQLKELLSLRKLQTKLERKSVVLANTLHVKWPQVVRRMLMVSMISILTKKNLSRQVRRNLQSSRLRRNRKR